MTAPSKKNRSKNSEDKNSNSGTDWFEMTPIGILTSGFKEKFGTPRQPGLIPMPASIHMLHPFDTPDAFDGIESFSHLWIEFVFHKNTEKGWQPKVRPPRMGGNEKRGVFATRSPFRPNGLGLSCVKFERLRKESDGLWLDITGVDIMEGTPVLDIKPYLPYADNKPDACSSFASDAPKARLQIEWQKTACHQLKQSEADHPNLKEIIEATLSLDPRPAYQEDQNRVYGTRLFEFDVQWKVINRIAIILDILPAGQKKP
ncbi:MAG: tRNA (N6-threonylcarbamoyladenosine(37)-N6)-methyltransferase TrmO [Gammaproteobacteria bacterium]|nr:MAG: tRNA (N6-threonylcarbamoyladenosine(37)-N6)-methyltransferase TrmO [Pseudomonadota bacterium]PIE38226.1 MAG: tRNA (N6-threonylcarbamoyladenosine(37)-N6)-methyltransferase TrmO [Gammaproteobacteria bacterium]